MKTGFAALEAIILFIAGIIFVVIVLVFATNAYGNIVYGSCWQKTSEGLSTLKGDMQSQTPAVDKVYVGDCIGAVVVFNKGFSDRSADPVFADFISSLEKQYCPNGDKPADTAFKSYILMIPWKTLNAASDTGTWQQLKNKLNEYANLQMFQKPYCLGVERKYADNTYYIPSGIQTSSKLTNMNTQNLQLCLSVTKASASGEMQYQLSDAGTICITTK